MLVSYRPRPCFLIELGCSGQAAQYFVFVGDEHASFVVCRLDIPKVEGCVSS